MSFARPISTRTFNGPTGCPRNPTLSAVAELAATEWKRITGGIETGIIAPGHVQRFNEVAENILYGNISSPPITVPELGTLIGRAAANAGMNPGDLTSVLSQMTPFVSKEASHLEHLRRTEKFGRAFLRFIIEAPAAIHVLPTKVENGSSDLSKIFESLYSVFSEGQTSLDPRLMSYRGNEIIPVVKGFLKSLAEPTPTSDLAQLGVALYNWTNRVQEELHGSAAVMLTKIQKTVPKQLYDFCPHALSVSALTAVVENLSSTLNAGTVSAAVLQASSLSWSRVCGPVLRETLLQAFPEKSVTAQHALFLEAPGFVTDGRPKYQFILQEQIAVIDKTPICIQDIRLTKTNGNKDDADYARVTFRESDFKGQRTLFIETLKSAKRDFDVVFKALVAVSTQEETLRILVRENPENAALKTKILGGMSAGQTLREHTISGYIQNATAASFFELPRGL